MILSKKFQIFDPIRMSTDRLELSFYLKARDQIEWFRDECSAGDRPIHLVWRYSWAHNPEVHYADHLLKQWDLTVGAIAAYLKPEHCQKPGDLLMNLEKSYSGDLLRVQLPQRVPAQMVRHGQIPAIAPPPKVLMFRRRNLAIGDEFLGNYWELEAG